MLPHDEDRRTYVCCSVMLGVPIMAAAAQVTMTWITERWAPQVTPAVFPSWFLSGIISGAATAWAALLLPGGRTVLTAVVTVSGFVVGAAIYALFAWVFTAYRGF